MEENLDQFISSAEQKLDSEETLDDLSSTEKKSTESIIPKKLLKRNLSNGEQTEVRKSPQKKVLMDTPGPCASDASICPSPKIEDESVLEISLQSCENKESVYEIKRKEETPNQTLKTDKVETNIHPRKIDSNDEKKDLTLKSDFVETGQTSFETQKNKTSASDETRKELDTPFKFDSGLIDIDQTNQISAQNDLESKYSKSSENESSDDSDSREILKQPLERRKENLTLEIQESELQREKFDAKKNELVVPACKENVKAKCDSDVLPELEYIQTSELKLYQPEIDSNLSQEIITSVTEEKSVRPKEPVKRLHSNSSSVESIKKKHLNNFKQITSNSKPYNFNEYMSEGLGLRALKFLSLNPKLPTDSEVKTTASESLNPDNNESSKLFESQTKSKMQASDVGQGKLKDPSFGNVSKSNLGAKPKSTTSLKLDESTFQESNKSSDSKNLSKEPDLNTLINEICETFFAANDIVESENVDKECLSEKLPIFEFSVPSEESLKSVSKLSEQKKSEEIKCEENKAPQNINPVEISKESKLNKKTREKFVSHEGSSVPRSVSLNMGALISFTMDRIATIATFSQQIQFYECERPDVSMDMLEDPDNADHDAIMETLSEVHSSISEISRAADESVRNICHELNVIRQNTLLGIICRLQQEIGYHLIHVQKVTELASTLTYHCGVGTAYNNCFVEYCRSLSDINNALRYIEAMLNEIKNEFKREINLMKLKVPFIPEK